VREVPKETETYSSNESEFVLDYKERKGTPYIAEMLDVPFLYKEMKSDMDSIDEWVTFEIERRGLNGKKESYREVINDLSKKLKFPKTLAPSEKINRLSVLLKKANETLRYYKKLGLDLQSLEQIYEGEL